MRRAYDVVASLYAEHLPDTRAESALDLAVLDAFIAAVLAGPAGHEGQVLDAGCGAGRVSRYVADRGCHVTGVDLSPGMIEMARRDHPDLSFEVASLDALPFDDATFAGVMVWYSAIHTPLSGQAAIFAELARVLRPGGHLVVAFQSGEGVRDAGPSYARFNLEVELERYLYTPDQVVGFVTDAGLTEVARMVRRAQGPDRDDQTVLLAQLPL
ncbi:methyltransferase [Knoellia subterranea KCTC 19937]|uniref:Methyltransferase n=1 Tax=Knoellia subterranea KCTC 19937 TaxID=1385521 RepID=A0A0A0JL66_9MICO|nr:methyltransferase [Knoellia subterranea KCTC 19937]